MLKVEGIYKSYNKKKILTNLSFTLNSKEHLAIIGKSGIGKTTLFNLIAGLERVDKGKVILDNVEITNKVGFVSYMRQKDLLLPYYTVLDNVILPKVIGGVKKKIARREATLLLKTFGLEGTEALFPQQLSGGMKQRAALLRTFLFRKSVMILDEPFSALDAITKNSMHKWYLSLELSNALSTIFITHDAEEALLLSDRVLVLGENTKEGKENGAEVTAEIKTNRGRVIKELYKGESDKYIEDYRFTKEFISLKRLIYSKLK